MSAKANKPLEGAFDAYHIWLGIAPKNQPPHHYCLLGIELFEQSADAIANAADQRMAHLRSFQTGRHSALSQKLLNQVAAAKVCLLDAAKKANYDQALREKMRVSEGRKVCPRPNPLPKGEGTFISAPGAFQIESLLGSEDLRPSRQRRRVPKKQGGLALKLGMGGGIAALLVAGVVAWQCTHQAPRDEYGGDHHAENNGHSGGHHAERDEYDRTRPDPSETIAAGDDEPPKITLASTFVAKAPPLSLVDSGSANPLKAPQEPASLTPNDFDKLAGTSEIQQAGYASEVPKPGLVDKKALTPGPSPSGRGEQVAGPSPSGRGEQVAGPSPIVPLATGGRGERQATTGKLPPPSDETQREVTARLSKELGLTEAKTPDAKLKRAETLFRMNERFADRPDERFVVLRTVADFAGQGGDASLVVAAVDATAGQFEIDALKAKEGLLKRFAAGPATAPRIRSLVRGSRPVIDQAVGAKDYDAALELAELVCKLCQGAQGKEYRNDAAQCRAAVQKAAEEHRRIEAAQETLKTDPDDGPANLLLGRSYCTAEKDWTHGLQCLVKAADRQLREIAERDLAASPGDAEQQAKLGDGWWDLAQTRAGQDRTLCLLRAGFWYQKAMAKMPSGLLRIRTEKRIADIRAGHLAW